MKKWPVPIEVSFRAFVAITFAGTIFFHVIGLGLHSYLNGQKNALIEKIESLAEAESQVSEIDASLSSFHEELLQNLTNGKLQKAEGRKLLLQSHLIRILIRHLDDRQHQVLPVLWRSVEKNGASCLSNLDLHGNLCVQSFLSKLEDFQRLVVNARRDDIRRLSIVERRQDHLDQLDTWLYWGTTILGLLFMGMGWRNVILQVGEPIKDVAGYIQRFDETALPKSAPLIPPLFSISELSVLIKNMSRIYRDPLTGALLRRAIVKIVAREIARSRKEGSPVAVGIFDVDGLTRFNSLYGYAAGDTVLQHVASRIQESLGEGEFLGRWGGEEFIVVTPGMRDNSLESHYDRIRKFVSSPCRLNSGEEVPVTVSLGASTLLPGQTEDDLLRKAEGALVRAKEARESASST